HQPVPALDARDRGRGQGDLREQLVPHGDLQREADPAPRSGPEEGDVRRTDGRGGAAVLLRRSHEVHLQPARIRAVRAENDLRADTRLERGHGPARAEVASGDGDIRVPEGRDVPAVLHAASRHEGDGRRQAGRGGRAEDALPGEGPGPPAADGGLPEGDRLEQDQDRSPEHGRHGRRGRSRDDRLLPEGAEGQGRDDGDLRQQVGERGAQHRLRAEEVRRAVGEADRHAPCRSQGTESGHADRPLRDRPEAARVRGGDDARQRLLRDAALLGNAHSGAPALVQGDVLGPGHVQVLLLDPRARHERDDRRHAVRLRRSGPRALALAALAGAALVVAGTGALTSIAAGESAPTGHIREYWVAAVPVTWNVVPNGRNAIEGESFTPDKTVFKTVVYRQFTKDFATPV